MRQSIDYGGVGTDLYTNSFVREIDPALRTPNTMCIMLCVDLPVSHSQHDVTPLGPNTLTLKYQYPKC